MGNIIEKIKVAIIAVFGALAGWLGALAVPFGLLILANIVDYVTGLVAAPYRNQQRNSYKGIKGIAKKVCMWLLVGVGVMVDVLLTYCTDGLGLDVPVKLLVGCIVAVWLLTNELISIIENISDIGVDIPPFLMPIVKWVKQKAETTASDAVSKDISDTVIQSSQNTESTKTK